MFLDLKICQPSGWRWSRMRHRADYLVRKGQIWNEILKCIAARAFLRSERNCSDSFESIIPSSSELAATIPGTEYEGHKLLRNISPPPCKTVVVTVETSKSPNRGHHSFHFTWSTSFELHRGISSKAPEILIIRSQCPWFEPKTTIKASSPTFRNGWDQTPAESQADGYI